MFDQINLKTYKLRFVNLYLLYITVLIYHRESSIPGKQKVTLLYIVKHKIYALYE